jgi:rubrerythrin
MNPFVDMVPERKMTIAELVTALRLDLAGEQEAISTYMAHVGATDHPLAKKVLTDIADEERVHTGELLRLIQILTKDEDDFLAQGKNEVEDMRKKKAK